MKPRPLEAQEDADAPHARDPAALRAWIVRLFADKLNIEVPSAETDLMESGALDSLALVELLLHLERDLGIAIAIENLDLENFRSVARISDFIARGNGALHRNGNGRS